MLKKKKKMMQEKRLKNTRREIIIIIIIIISDISHKKTWMWLRKGNLKRETECLLIAAQNNAIRTMSKQE